ncbi:MAG: flagellar basal body rod protein FlgB [Candidatus Aureabacteria bacterium]|nr:flagellar basal body rod protein FlgB [Candidatus Auribacterota bacterium]
MNYCLIVLYGIKHASPSIIAMFDRILNTTSINVMKKLMDCSAIRQKVIANNIANVETPGFKAKDVSFKGEFVNALKSGEFDRAFRIEPVVIERNDLSLRNDGNNVDLEKEMVELQKNRMKFSIYTDILKGRYKKIKELFTHLAK